MATGYDSRQSGRESFAFQPAAPVQGTTGAQGGQQRAQIVGGQSSGGGIASGPMTEPAPIAGDLGSFFGKLLEPFVQRKQEERFFQGFSAAQSGIALDELDRSNKGINKIFGPSSFEEGAHFYTAKAAINKWSVDMDGDMDNLKRMSREDAAKVIAAKSSDMMTGHAGADQLIQQGIMEASGPMLNTIAKERYAFQQEQASAAVSESWATGAASLQSTMVRQNALSDPSDGGQAAQIAAMRTFTESMAKPFGMDDDSYKKNLIGFIRNAAQNGNGYAVTALTQAGVMDVLNDEERTKLEDAVLKYGNRAIGEAALALGPRLLDLHGAMLMGEITGTKAMAEAASINAEAKRLTGFDVDLFDPKEAIGVGKTVMTAVKARMDLAQNRQWELQDRAQARRWKLEDDQTATSAKAVQIMAAWGGGNIKQWVALGVGSQANYDSLAQQDYARGDLSRITRAYNNDGWVSGLVSEQLKANVQSSIGQQYNPDFEAGYKRFDAFNKAKPAMAQAYMGDLYIPMLKYQKLLATSTPTIAFAQAFSNPAQYSTVALPEGTATKAKKAIGEYIASQRSSAWTGGGWMGLTGRSNLNASGEEAYTSALTSQLAIMGSNSNVPYEALIPQLEEAAMQNGSLERYGQHAWTNPQGTTPLGKALNLQQDEADEIIPKVIDYWLRKSGNKDGGNGAAYDIRRFKDARGNAVVSIMAEDKDDDGYQTTVIPFAAFKESADGIRASRVATGVAPSRFNQTDPYRRVAGESGAVRLARINREVKAGANPAKALPLKT